MSNKEIYDNAVAKGLEFTYFKGEDECPYDDEPKSVYWEAEYEVACDKDNDEIEENFEETEETEIPEFIRISSASKRSKSVALAAYNKYWSWCPAPVKVENINLGPFGDYYDQGKIC